MKPSELESSIPVESSDKKELPKTAQMESSDKKELPKTAQMPRFRYRIVSCRNLGEYREDFPEI